jgi:uncharacterized protein involved in response to NO
VNRRPQVARADWTFPWYIGASLLIAVGGGFALALLLPLAQVEGWNWGLRWPALVQAHGHLQVLGWVGFFVIGMGFRLIPRFAGRPLRFAPVTPVILVLILTALLGRAVAQPWLDKPGMTALLVGSAWMELVGALLFAGVVVATLTPVARTLSVAPFFLLGGLGLLGQAVLAALWLPALLPTLPVMTPGRDGVLLDLQFYAFLLPFVLGVSLRSLPTFFKHRAPRSWELWVLAGLLAIGSSLSAAPALWGPGLEGGRSQQIGALLIAAAMVGAFLETGVWKRAEGLRPSARHTALLLRTAYIWLLLAAGLLAFSAVSGLRSGQPVQNYEADAVRHMLALGLFSTLIAGMAQLLLPWLAQRRLNRRAAKTETWVLWSLFTLAAVLRTSGALLEGFGAGNERYWLIVISGLLGIAAVLFLGMSVLHAAWKRPWEITLAEVGRL